MPEQYIVANLGLLRCGFDARSATEALPLSRVARVPFSPRFIHGVMNHQGRLLTLVNLSRFFDLEDGEAPRIALVVDRQELSLGFCAVDVQVVEQRDVVRIPQVKPYLRDQSWITESLSTPNFEFQHLDLQRIIDSIEESL